MADDSTSLLLKIRGDSAGGKAAVSETRAAIAQLRSTTGKEFGTMQSVANSALGSISSSVTNLASSIPGIGSAATNATSSLAAIGGAAAPIAAVVTVALALDAAVIGLGIGLFNVTKQSADLQGKLFDLSQQTGVAVETLSTLGFFAKTTGSDIGQISASLGIYQRHIEEAQDPTSKMGLLFAELGISTVNTEEALRDTLKALAAMPEGFHQTATALELFGRGGKSILAILKEMHGDLDGATERLREMGLVISKEDAEAADKFNDELIKISAQLQRVGIIIGNEFMPEILSAAQELSTALKDSREGLQALATLLSTVVGPAIKYGIVQPLIGAINVLNIASDTFRTARTFVLQLAEGYDILTAAVSAYYIEQGRSILNAQFAGVTGGAGSATPPFIPEMGGGFGRFKAPKTSGGGGRARAARAEPDTSNADEQRRLDYYNELVDVFNKLEAAYDGIDVASRKYEVEQSILNGVLKDADEALQNMARTIAGDIDADIKKTRLTKELSDFLIEQRDAIRLVDEGEASHLRQAQDMIESLERQGAILSDTQKNWLQLNAIYLDVKTRGEELIPVINELTEAMANQKLATEGPINIDIGEAPNQPLNQIVAGAVEAGGAIQGLGAIIQESLGLSKEYADTFGNSIAQTFSMIAEGVGAAVRAFVLFGGAQGSFKKFAAEVIASVAQMAIVQAVFELAQGLAMLALNFFFPNPKYAASAAAHFQAAAVFGAIGAGAAIIGRGVAGSAFASQGASGGGASSGGSGGSSGSSTPQPVDVGRRTSITSQADATLTLRIPSGWFGDEMRKDYDLNGFSRLIITSGE